MTADEATGEQPKSLLRFRDERRVPVIEVDVEWLIINLKDRGYVVLTADEAARVLGHMPFLGADLADTSWGRELLADRALLTPSEKP